MKTIFSKKDLVKFGNFLLSDERKVKPINKQNVTDADIEDFLEKIKKVD